MFSSGAAHRPGMWDEMTQVLGVSQLFTAYGQTETMASTMCVQPDDPLWRLVATNGCAKPGGIAGDAELDGTLARYKVVHPETGEEVSAGEIGELLVRGPIVTPGYYDKPEETKALFDDDGWMRTGDLGRLDAQGYLSLTGRTKESYRCGGELVLPSEVEEVLVDHPGVAAAYVVSVPHRRMGEVGCAWVVPADGAAPVAEELVAYCSSRLARFKVPALVLYTTEDQVPRTVTGRVQKFELAARAVAAQPSVHQSVRL
jgi:fatty-acyl-CoA synthase